MHTGSLQGLVAIIALVRDIRELHGLLVPRELERHSDTSIMSDSKLDLSPRALILYNATRWHIRLSIRRGKFILSEIIRRI